MKTDLIDLKIDFAFKLVFGREGQEPVLVAFLNAVFKPLNCVGSGERGKSHRRKIH